MEFPPVHLTPSQAARQLGVTTDRVRQLFAAGKLPYVQTPLGRLVDPEELEHFIKSRTNRSTGSRIAKAARDA